LDRRGKCEKGKVAKGGLSPCAVIGWGKNTGYEGGGGSRKKRNVS